MLQHTITLPLELPHTLAQIPTGTHISRVHTGVLFTIVFAFSSVSTPYVAFTPKRVLNLGNFYPHFECLLRDGTFLGEKSAPVLIGWANCKPRPVQL